MDPENLPFPSTVLTAASLEKSIRLAGEAHRAILEEDTEAAGRAMVALEESLADCLDVTCHLTSTLARWRDEALAED